jgi:hypothetical protein
MATSTARTKVVICRLWNKPAIEAYVYSDQVGTRMDLDDFAIAVCEEVGSPLLILTKAQLLVRVQEAIKVVSAEMKSTTTYVV